jgi:hypothetical protein
VLAQGNNVRVLDGTGQIAQQVFGGDDRLQAIHVFILAGSLGLAECGDAKINWRDAGQSFGLLSFLPQEGKGEVDALDLTKPRLVLRAGSASQQVVLDLIEPRQHFRINVEHWTTQTSLTEMILE